MTTERHITPTIKLVRKLGEGGMGTVWAAENLALGTEVAVKMLAREYANDKQSVARFKYEAQRAARVKSLHVATVFDHGMTNDDEPYLVMELLEGETLRDRIKRAESLPLEDVERLIVHTAKALSAAHKLGVVHRDIKPENLFIVDNEGEPHIKVVDFGIAKQMDAPPDLTMRTPTGMMMGTPPYMSPEQYTDPTEVDWRTDLWSLGIVTYEAITGIRPFYGRTMVMLAVAITEGSFTPPSTIKPEVPKALDQWMAKALAKRPAERFGSAMEMADALTAILNPTSIRRPQSSLPPKVPTGDDAPTLVFEPPKRISVKPAAADDGPISVGRTVPDRRSSHPPPVIARRGDLKGPLFPAERAPILIARTFDAVTVARIEAGIEPQSEAEKWFVFTEDNHVYFHRWVLGNPVYEVILEPTARGGKRIAQAWVAASKKATHNAAHLAKLFDDLFFDGPSSSPVSARGDALQPGQRIWVHEGDLTMLTVDAIVSSSESSLLGGTGVDGDIYRAAGAGLLAECRALQGCRVGEAKMTKGHALPVKHVIHTVGPTWRGGLLNERGKLADCYVNSLALAANASLRTVAFPSISTGTKNFPLDDAAFIAATSTLKSLAQRSSVELVIFCTFTPKHTEAARAGLAKALSR